MTNDSTLTMTIMKLYNETAFKMQISLNLVDGF